jgi:hypothetical protein
MPDPPIIVPAPPVNFPTVVTGLLNVGPGSNPPSSPPDPTKGNVAAVWGYVGLSIGGPSQTSSPPITCAVFGNGGVVGVNGFDGVVQDTESGGEGVIGFGGTNGVRGFSTSGTGVAGTSTSGNGVIGKTTSGDGVLGTTTSGNGVLGTSSTGNGVFGTCEASGAGVAGQSNTGAGVWGKCTDPSGLAGQFEGNVRVDGTLTANGNVQINGTATVTGDVILPGADCAEQFDTAGALHIEPGTVVVIDEDGALRESLEPYDKKVAGVVSGGGDYKPAIVLDKRASGKYRAAVALVGKVCCKVDAQYAPINVGDPLTTSPTPGHAMKAAEPGKAFGAVIGKALRPLDKGQGLIPILIALQ